MIAVFPAASSLVPGIIGDLFCDFLPRLRGFGGWAQVNPQRAKIGLGQRGVAGVAVQTQAMGTRTGRNDEAAAIRFRR